ncbi:MAG: hypothetical protein KF774_03065 [Planctomyces sp.]|nr:hypothetical protein [Planctomyces sp.]
MRRRPAAFAAVLFALPCLIALVAGSASAGDVVSRCGESVCCCYQRTQSSGWKVLESKCFRIHYVGGSELAERLVPICERNCHDLRSRWLGVVRQGGWSVKCDVYLYPTGAEFERRSRFPQQMWGVADLSVGDGRVWMRRLHVRTDDRDKLENVLVHELTHVVLAERFTDRQIPRWADEGIAVLSEPAERREHYAEWLRQEASSRRLYSLRELTRFAHVPQGERQSELFYGQSGALVEYLLTERKLSEAEILKLIDDVQRRGWESAVSKQFPTLSSVRFESEWRDWLLSRPATEIAASVAPSASAFAAP